MNFNSWAFAAATRRSCAQSSQLYNNTSVRIMTMNTSISTIKMILVKVQDLSQGKVMVYHLMGFCGGDAQVERAIPLSHRDLSQELCFESRVVGFKD